MATRKGLELRTDFTASDTSFQSVLRRTQKGVKKLGTNTKKAGATAAKAMDKFKQKLDQVKTKAGQVKAVLDLLKDAWDFDKSQNEKLRDIKFGAQTAKMDIASFQKLTHVFRGFKIEAEEAAEIVREFANVTGEAFREPEGTKGEAFKQLHIDLEKFMKLSTVEKFQQLAQAYRSVLKEDKGTIKAEFASEELLGGESLKLQNFLMSDPAAFVRKFNQAQFIPETGVMAGADAFEWQRIKREQFETGGLNKWVQARHNVTAQKNPLINLLTGDRSAFDPSIKGTDEGEKKKKADAERKRESAQKALENAMKSMRGERNFPALMGLSVTGGAMGVRMQREIKRDQHIADSAKATLSIAATNESINERIKIVANAV